MIESNFALILHHSRDRDRRRDEKKEEKPENGRSDSETKDGPSTSTKTEGNGAGDRASDEDAHSNDTKPMGVSSLLSRIRNGDGYPA